MLREFRSEPKGFPDLLNYYALVSEGVLFNKDGSLLAAWWYAGPDMESATPNEMAVLAAQINGALRDLGNGWMIQADAIRKPAPGYALAGAFPHLGARCQVAVIAVPDDDKGEKLVAAANDARLTLADIRAAVRAKGLSNLCAPRELRLVRTIPKLGTGKTDHRALARELAAAPAPAETAALVAAS